MKRILFACYGGGHVRMVLPVAQALRDQGLAQVQVLGLTTAAPAVREAGMPLLQVKDFTGPSDVAVLARGRELTGTLAHVVDAEETAAYLGLGWQELVAAHGALAAAQRYAAVGRQAFLPVAMLRRVLERVAPDLVVATSSPRAERAAIMAAGQLGIRSACLVDMFCVDEVAWVGQPGYADRVCVLNADVRQFLLNAGRDPAEVVVTGNPAFDALNAPDVVAAGRAMRAAQGWAQAQVVVWASQPEPASHPSVPGRQGDPALPRRILQALLRWQAAAPGRVLVVRPHPSEPPQAHPSIEGVRWDGRQFPLHPLLHAADAVVTMNSTVGLEAHLAGRRTVQVLGSLFDESVPLARFGMATRCDRPESLPALLPGVLARPAPAPQPPGSATRAVVDVLKEL